MMEKEKGGSNIYFFMKNKLFHPVQTQWENKKTRLAKAGFRLVFFFSFNFSLPPPREGFIYFQFFCIFL